ncbi:hypothetical protein [Actinopolyspora erythraea]|uniref:hypothetical protein n=1 Tax=Actinopolyspora erythraea TaxID=414996 RepID=UPI001185D384|nr:hypothetical protein [Actinopolyspora erythraea]
MSIHYTTFVIPKSLGLEYDTPAIAFGSDTADEIPKLPLPTSVHVMGNEACPLSHADMMSQYAMRISDIWIQATRSFENCTKIAVIQEPVPTGNTTEKVDPSLGVMGDELPYWVEDLVNARLKMAMREVSVSYGESALSIMMDASAPTTLPDWAHMSN